MEASPTLCYVSWVLRPPGAHGFLPSMGRARPSRHYTQCTPRTCLHGRGSVPVLGHADGPPASAGLVCACGAAARRLSLNVSWAPGTLTAREEVRTMTANVRLVLVRTPQQPRPVVLEDGCCSCSAARP